MRSSTGTWTTLALGATGDTYKMEIGAPFGVHSFILLDDEGHLLLF